MSQDRIKRPAFQFYPADWRKDMQLQSCGVAARGLWIDLMCIAHECEPYGHLTVNANAMTAAQIARHVGITERECSKLLAELEHAGVFSRNEQGAIFSRRMVRDEAIRNRRAEGGKAGSEHGIKGAEHGSKGGRPRSERGDKKPPFEPPNKPPPSSSSSSSTSVIPPVAPQGGPEDPNAEQPELHASPAASTPSVPCPLAKIVALYHEILPTLPRAKLMPAGRERAIRKVWAWVLSSRRSDGHPRAHNADEALAWLRRYFETAARNDFLMGRSGRSAEHANWQCDIDFLLSDRGMKQVIEKTQEAA